MQSQIEVQEIDKFVFFKNNLIGQGQFGRVYVGCYNPNFKKNSRKIFAVKIIEVPYNMNKDDRYKRFMNNLLCEINNLVSVRHRNIVKLYDVQTQKNQIFFITEYCNQGVLTTFIRKNNLTENEILFYFAQILEGFKYLRRKMIIHRDVKPDNILIHNGVIKIADFGFSRNIDNNQMMESYMGTPITMSPQMKMGVKYSDKTDIYSLGVVLYFMYYKDYPYKGYNDLRLIEALKQGVKPVFKKGVQISDSIKQLIIDMMQYSEKKRIDWNDLFNFHLIKNNNEVNDLNLLLQSNLQQIQSDSDDEDYLDNIKHESIIQRLDITQYSKDDVDQLQINYENIMRQQKLDKLIIKINNRIIFEKGLVYFIRRVKMKLHNFMNKNSQLRFQVHYEFFIILKFVLVKHELQTLKNILNMIKFEKEGPNPFDLMDEEWKYLKDNIDIQKNYQFLQMDIQNLEIKIYKDNLYDISQLRQKSNCFPKQFRDILKLDIFDVQKHDENEFTEFLNTLVLDFISYFDSILNKVNLKDIVLINSPEIKELMSLLDEMLILTNSKSIFVWNEQKNFNFNTFFEERDRITEQEPHYSRLIHRIMLVFVYFVKVDSK